MEVLNTKVIKSSLMEHQVEAVRWMADRENSSDLPPFWVLDSQSTYYNKLTDAVTGSRPAPFRGGILADDMGLGKTLSIIALIASNSPPLAKEDEEAKEQEEEAKEEDLGEDDDARPSKRRKTTDHEVKTSVAEKEQRATLVVCPLSVMGNWVNQIAQHTEPGSLKVHVFHGSGRHQTAEALAKCDVVITTYATLSAEWKTGKQNSVLRNVSWLRVVLDEAHIIKNSKAQHTQCAVALEAERRWAVTGTPLQNSATDVFSLVQFLHLESLDEVHTWKRLITKLIESRTRAKEGFRRLQQIVSAVTLRRTKEEARSKGEVMADLPPKVVELFPVKLSQSERNMYDEMEKAGKLIFHALMKNGMAKRRYELILEILLRLRQICADLTLCNISPEAMQEAAMDTINAWGDEDNVDPDDEEDDDGYERPKRCLVPQKAVQKSTSADPAHDQKAASMYIVVGDKEDDDDELPVQSPQRQGTVQTSSSSSDDTSTARAHVRQAASSKTLALISLLKETRKKDPSIKSVVFSQFSKMLKLLEGPLTRSGFKFVKINGSMSASQREQAMEEFKSTEKGSPTVFLLSLKAAGVGLNLVSASNVYMMDPWWNPAVEEQAMDRVHRVGQMREVRVIRMIASKTIEERILKLQEKKRATAEIALGDEDMLEPRLKCCMEDVKLLLGCSRRAQPKEES